MNATVGGKAAAGIGLLVRCYEGMRNWRAFAMLAGAMVCGFLLSILATMMTVNAGFIVGALTMLIALVVYLAGINGAGLLLLDQADGRPLRGFGAAFIGGLHGTWISFLAFLLLGLGMACVLLGMYLLAFLTRIPGVGSIFAFLFSGPGAIVLAFCYGLLAIGTPLMLVAVWRGAGVLGAIGRAVDIVVKRPLDALLHFVVLAILVIPVAAFVIGLLTATSTLSLSIFSGGGFGSAMSMFGHSSSFGGFGMVEDSGPFGGMMSHFRSAGGASASVGAVMLVLVALFVLVGMFGYIMIHDSLGAGLDANAEERLRGGVSQIKRKLDEHRSQAQAPVATTSARTCAHCGTGLQGDDRFCGDCGQPA